MLSTKGMWFSLEVILVCIRWYAAYPLSYRQLEEMMQERVHALACLRAANATEPPNARRPNFMAVAGYDGMNATYRVAKQLNGKIDPDKTMELLKGMKINSSRGPLTIDPIQTV